MAKRKKSPAKKSPAKTPTHYAYDDGDCYGVRKAWNAAMAYAKGVCAKYAKVDLQTAKKLRELAIECAPDGWAIGAKLKPTINSGSLGGYAIECEGIVLHVFEHPTSPGIRILVPREGGVCKNLGIQAAGSKFALTGMWGKAITADRAAKVARDKAKVAKKAPAKAAKAAVVAEVIADAPVADRMGNLREILAMFPEATLAEAMGLLDA
jgi:hypothetical protein